jgi:hypothetical protein
MPGFFKSGNWNENNLNPLSRINWRASLVPAAAVIPAPIAYIKVVAVKKLVVGFLVETTGLLFGVRTCVVLAIFCEDLSLPLSWWVDGLASFTVKKLECLKQAFAYF